MRVVRNLMFGVSALALSGAEFALAQTQLPEVRVNKPKPAEHHAPPRKHTATTRRPAHPRAVVPVVARPPGPTPEQAAAQATAAKANSFDQARSNVYTTVGTTSDTITHDDIADLPQGTNTTVEKVLLQAPGVSQDSAASGSLHVRNDHANVQYRINGVMIPDGVTGFTSILETGLIGKMSLVTGALPAEYGLRTVGLVDITTRADAFDNSGTVSLYGGSRGTFTPSIEYGGTFGGNCSSTAPGPVNAPGPVKAPPAPSTADCLPGVQYYVIGRYLQTTEGIENPTPALNAIHDFSRQEKGFAYLSAFIDPTTRVTMMEGTAISSFQIPNNPGQPVGMNGSPPVTNAFGATNFDSALLNENQTEITQFAVVALQKSVGNFNGQLSYFTRYSDLHYTPDPIGDLLLNGVASDITRRSFTNGIQGDGSYVLNPAHTLRAGFFVSGEQAFVGNTSLVEPCVICDGSDNGAPQAITDDVSKLAWLMGAYAQDEWKITDRLIINAGLRFDQMVQFIDANQFSPRVSLTYKPFDHTTFHVGYARYFTPPVLVEAAPTNIALFDNTTAAVPTGQGNSPVLPERSHYFDAGIDQKIPINCSAPTAPSCAVLDLGIDAYYKIATDLIDNGNFGQALVLDAFNYAKGINEGIEFSAKFRSGSFQAYANFAVAQQKATDPVSNQYLFDNTTPLADLGGLTELQYLQTHWIYTDHTQIMTGSAGLAYEFCGRPAYAVETFGGPRGVAGYSWCGTKVSADMIYGSGLRNGDANIDTVPPYLQFNASIGREFLLPDDPKPMTVRFDVVNVFDTVYEIRDGSGIGVFAPQYGPRREFFLGVSKKF